MQGGLRSYAGVRERIIRVRHGRVRVKGDIFHVLWVIMPWKYGRALLNAILHDWMAKRHTHGPVVACEALVKNDGEEEWRGLWSGSRREVAVLFYCPGSWVKPLMDAEAVERRVGSKKHVGAKGKMRAVPLRAAAALAFVRWPAAWKWALRPFNPSIVVVRFAAVRTRVSGRRRIFLREALSILYACLASEDPMLRGRRRVVYFALPQPDQRMFEWVYPEALIIDNLGGASRKVWLYALKLDGEWRPVEITSLDELLPPDARSQQQQGEEAGPAVEPPTGSWGMEGEPSAAPED
ncbi:MAG: hypothetical protein QW324_05870 [Thermofilaceae archaeon]